VLAKLKGFLGARSAKNAWWLNEAEALLARVVQASLSVRNELPRPFALAEIDRGVSKVPLDLLFSEGLIEIDPANDGSFHVAAPTLLLRERLIAYLPRETVREQWRRRLAARCSAT
jgi:hypothetical protein